jgi:hypothetical protein
MKEAISSGRRKGSFLKKRTKKLLSCWRLRVARTAPQTMAESKQSFFGSFCSQKELLPLPSL